MHVALPLSAAAALLTGCSMTIDRRPTASPERACNALPAQIFVGRTLEPGMARRIRLRAGARTVRVITPGMAVTMDYRTDRANVSIDEHEAIIRIACG